MQYIYVIIKDIGTQGYEQNMSQIYYQFWNIIKGLYLFYIWNAVVCVMVIIE